MGEHVVDIAEPVKTASTSDHHNSHHHSHHQQQQQQQHNQSNHHLHSVSDLTRSSSHLNDSVEECRICQEEDHAGNLEIPCSCCGSLKYAHRKCVQRWCNEKGDTVCEICQQPFKGYTAPPVRHVQQQQSPLPHHHLRTEWEHQLDFGDPRILAMAAERHFFQEYDDYGVTNASGAACCRSAALILVALLLIRHTLTIGATGGDEDASTFFTVSERYRSSGFGLILVSCAAFLLKSSGIPPPLLHHGTSSEHPDYSLKLSRNGTQRLPGVSRFWTRPHHLHSSVCLPLQEFRAFLTAAE